VVKKKKERSRRKGKKSVENLGYIWKTRAGESFFGTRTAADADEPQKRTRGGRDLLSCKGETEKDEEKRETREGRGEKLLQNRGKWGKEGISIKLLNAGTSVGNWRGKKSHLIVSRQEEKVMPGA